MVTTFLCIPVKTVLCEIICATSFMMLVYVQLLLLTEVTGIKASSLKRPAVQTLTPFHILIRVGLTNKQLSNMHTQTNKHTHKARDGTCPRKNTFQICGKKVKLSILVEIQRTQGHYSVFSPHSCLYLYIGTLSKTPH